MPLEQHVLITSVYMKSLLRPLPVGLDVLLPDNYA